MVDALVLSMNHRTAKKVMRVIEENLGKSAKKPLLRGSRSRHYWLRWNSIRMLEKLGYSNQVDWVRAYILDLRHEAACSTRKLAARKLGELGDKRALPALRQAQKKGFLDNLCMGDALEDAILEIER